MSEGRIDRRALAIALAITVAWAAAFRVGVLAERALEALALASVIAVLVVARLVDLRAMLRPTARDVVVGAVFGAFTVAATLALYEPLRDGLHHARVLSGLGDEVRRFYAIVPFSLAVLPLVLLVAVAEEVVWRGLFLRAFGVERSAAHGGWRRRLAQAAPMVAVSSIAYALGQLGGAPVLGAVALFFGVLWAIEAVLTGSLVACVISHAVWTVSVFGVWPLEA